MVNRGEYVAPWSRQKELRARYSDDDLPTMEEIALLIDGIEVGTVNRVVQSLRAQALFALYYLTACRASEVLRTKSLRKQRVRKSVIFSDTGQKNIVYELDKNKQEIVDKEVLPHSYEGLKRKDITMVVIDGRKCMIVRAENRKNKKRSTKRLPIPIEKEWKVATYIFKYIDKLEPEDLLFPFGSKRATQIINETTGFNIHFIRHIRATHLVTKYDYNEQALIRFMGWTNSMPAKHYMELKSSDLFRQFYKGGQ